MQNFPLNPSFKNIQQNIDYCMRSDHKKQKYIEKKTPTMNIKCS